MNHSHKRLSCARIPYAYVWGFISKYLGMLLNSDEKVQCQ